jgi:hypothetical protein
LKAPNFLAYRLTDWSVIELTDSNPAGNQAGEGESTMRKQIFSGLLVSALMSALLVGAAIAQGKQQKVEFYLDGKVGNEVVKKGAYTVTLPEGNQGQVAIKVGKKVVTANVVKKENATAPDSDKMTYATNDDGTRTVTSLTPRGQKYTLVFEGNDIAKQPTPAPAKPGSQQ